VGLFSQERSFQLKTPWFILLLAVLVCVAFPQLVLGWETFVLRDFGNFAYPSAFFQRECFWRGELPFWNPFNNCGIPFLAQWNTMPLYPPALLYLILPLPWSLNFFCLLHLWFAGVGMYLLARRWTNHSLAAAVAGLVFAFNGLTQNLLMWPGHIATLSWMPWVVLAVERSWRKGGKSIPEAALAGALQMLAGGPETILLTWLLLAGLWVMEMIPARANKDRTIRLGRVLWVFPLVVVLVAALSSVQLLSFFQLAGHSQRHQGFADTRWSLPGRGWANFLVPVAFGSTWNQDVFFQYGQYWTSSYYLGTATLLLALLALWMLRDRRVWFLGCAGALCYICALGNETFVYRALRHLLPQLTLITYPVKFVTVIVFASPLLAAYALASWFRSPDAPVPANVDKPQSTLGIPRGRLLVLTAALLGLIVGIVVWERLAPLPLDNFPAVFRNAIIRAVFLGAVVGLLRLAQRDLSVRGRNLSTFILLLLVRCDLWSHEPPQNPTAPASVYTPGVVRAALAMNPQPALGESRIMVSPAADDFFDRYRTKDMSSGYLGRRFGYFSDCNLLDGVPKVNGFFSLVPSYYATVEEALYHSTNFSFPRVEDFLGVSHVTAPGEFNKFEVRSTFLPMVTAGQKPVFLDDTNAFVSLLRPDFDGSRIVLLPREAQEIVSVRGPTTARVLSHEFSFRGVSFEIEAVEASLAVISQTWFPCWQAYIDGKPATLLRANFAFQAMQVPAGRHQVRLVYEDRLFRRGAIVSGLTLLGCLVFWGLRWREPKG
jgi:hypothetical protein